MNAPTSIRFTPEEKEVAVAMAKERGMSCISDLIRSLVRSGQQDDILKQLSIDTAFIRIGMMGLLNDHPSKENVKKIWSEKKAEMEVSGE